MRKHNRKQKTLLFVAMAAASCGLVGRGVLFAQSYTSTGDSTRANQNNHPLGIVTQNKEPQNGASLVRSSDAGYETPNQWYHRSNTPTWDASLTSEVVRGTTAATGPSSASGTGAYGNLLYDNFAKDSGLNTSLWTASGTVAATVLANNNQGAPTTIFTPTLSFEPGQGMLMTGLDGQAYRQGGIQSLDSFSGPFSLNVDLTPAKVDVGGFQIGISNANGGSGIEVIAGSGPSSSFTGIWYSQPTGPGSYWAQDGHLSSSAPAVGKDYSIGIAVDTNGMALVSAEQEGVLLGSATADVGTGPFYVILSEGDGLTGGDSAALWQSVQLTSGATPIVGPVTANWINPNNGNWEAAANWSEVVNGTATNIVPDEVANPGYQFNVNIDGSAANLSSSATINSLTLGNTVGEGSLAVSGGLSIVNNVTVGNAASASLFVLPGGTVTDASASITANGGAGGSQVTVSGKNATWATANGLFIGNGGLGILNITDGGSVSAANLWLGDGIGSSSNSNSSVNINGSQGGSATMLSVMGASGGYVYIGGAGNGALTVSAGGQMRDNSVWVNGGLGENGSVVVTGVGSNWTSTGGLYVSSLNLTYNTPSSKAALGSASLTVSNGAQVVAGQVTIGGMLGNDEYYNDGSVLVTGTGSELQATSPGGITIEGFNPYGSFVAPSLTVTAGGTVVSGTVSVLDGGVLALSTGGVVTTMEGVIIGGGGTLSGNGKLVTGPGAGVVVNSSGIITPATGVVVNSGGILTPAIGNLNFLSGLTLDTGSIFADTLGDRLGQVILTGGNLFVNGIVNLSLTAGSGFAINTPYTLLSLQSGASGVLNPADFLVSPGSAIQGLVSVSGGNLLFTPENNISSGTGWIRSSGNFGDGSNWSGGSPPNSSQPAIFVGSGAANSTPITVNFTANESNTELIDDDANVTLNLSGNTYSLTSTGTAGAIQVGGELGLGAILNVSGGLLQSTNAIISPYPTGNGNSDQMSLVSTSWSNSGNISVGDVGTGKLQIDQNSALQTGSMNIANQSGSQGEVDNAGKITATGSLSVNTGGVLNQTDGSTTAGSVENYGNINLSGGSFQGTLTNNAGGSIALQQSAQITLSGNVVNNGIIDIGAGTAVVSGTTTLSGTGTLYLGGSNVGPGQIIGTGAGATVDQLTNNSTIEGAGTIGDPTDARPFAFTNNGSLIANVNGQVLNVYGSVTGTTTGHAYATNGGILYFHSTYNQTGGNTNIGNQGPTSQVPNSSGWTTKANYYAPSGLLPPDPSTALPLSFFAYNGTSNVLGGSYYAVTQSQLQHFVNTLETQIDSLEPQTFQTPTVYVTIHQDPLQASEVDGLLTTAGTAAQLITEAPGTIAGLGEYPAVELAHVAASDTIPGSAILNTFGTLSSINQAEFDSVANDINQAQADLNPIAVSAATSMLPNGSKVAEIIAPGQALEVTIQGVQLSISLTDWLQANLNLHPNIGSPISLNLNAYDMQNINTMAGATNGGTGVKASLGNIGLSFQPTLWLGGRAQSDNLAANSGNIYEIEGTVSTGGGSSGSSGGGGYSGGGIVTSGGYVSYPNGATISGGGWGGNGTAGGSVNVSGNSTVFAGNPGTGGSTVTTGLLHITGNFVITSSFSGTTAQTPVLEFYIGGTTQGGNPGYDYIDVGGNASLSGDLEVGFANGFQGAVNAADNFDIITANTAITGNLSNVSSGQRINTIDGFGSFLVSYGIGSANPNEVVLSDFIPNPGSGLSQSTAIGPTSSANGVYVFHNIPSGAWVDPTASSSFVFEIATPGALFTKIDSFPTGFASTMNLIVDGYDIGPFAPGDGFDFSNLPGGGVSEFEITGITPLDGSLTDFPLQMEFNQSNVDFLMAAVPTPEPATLALFMLGGLGLMLRRRRGISHS